MQNTPNYGLKKPGQEDFYNVDDFNANTDIMDTEIANVNADISNLENNKLNKTGDASNVTNTFTQASTRANLVSGENQSTLFGKLMKWFADLKPVAWSGNASDLTEDANNRLVTDTEKTNWNGKASTAPVTTTANGLMISTDKSKLDGVATGANNYTHPSSHPPSIIAQDVSNRFVTDSEKATWNGKLNATGKAADSNLLDGFDSTQFARRDVGTSFADWIDVNGTINGATGLQSSDHDFQVRGDTGDVYFYKPSSNDGYYVKTDSGLSNTPIRCYTTLRMGDVAIHANDTGMEGKHIYRQQSMVDFGVESRNNEEGEECIFLLDILESMQSKINTLETEITILKGQ